MSVRSLYFFSSCQLVYFTQAESALQELLSEPMIPLKITWQQIKNHQNIWRRNVGSMYIYITSSFFSLPKYCILRYHKNVHFLLFLHERVKSSLATCHFDLIMLKTLTELFLCFVAWGRSWKIPGSRVLSWGPRGVLPWEGHSGATTGGSSKMKYMP